MKIGFNSLMVLLVGVAMATGTASADLLISTVDTPTVIDFDNTVSGSNNGAFTGAGIETMPTAGQLDASSWTVSGMNSSADLSRGTSSGGVSTGGVYSFDVGGGNNTLGIQPGGSDFTPGDVTLVIRNDTGFEISNFDVSYDIWTFNDEDRSNSFNFSYSTNGSSYTPVSAFDFASTETKEISPAWAKVDRVGNFSATIASASNLYLRWSGNDVSGSGARDEFGLDNVSISLSAVPEPSALLYGAMFAASALGFRRRRS